MPSAQKRESASPRRFGAAGATSPSGAGRGNNIVATTGRDPETVAVPAVAQVRSAAPFTVRGTPKRAVGTPGGLWYYEK